MSRRFKIGGYSTRREGSCGRVTPENVNRLSSTDGEDSDLELSQKNGSLFDSGRTASQSVARSVGKQPVISIL